MLTIPHGEIYTVKSRLLESLRKPTIGLILQWNKPNRRKQVFRSFPLIKGSKKRGIHKTSRSFSQLISYY